MKMTKEKVIAQIEKLKSYCEYMKDSDENGAYVFDLDVQALDFALSTLTQPNEPLTLEELKEMRGRPVWIDELYVWGLVKVIQEKVFLVTINGVYNAEQYKVYRRPPEGEEDT